MRVIELAEPHLVIDLEGEALSGGRRIAARRLLRASYIAPFDDPARRTLLQHGLRTVLDLRNPREVAKLPQSLSDTTGVDYVRLGIGDASKLEPGSCDSLAELYVGHVADNGAAIASAVARIAGGRRGATLVHCQTGRDRTGIVVAIALRLAGMPDAAIVDQHARVAAAVSAIVAARRAVWIGKGRDVGYFDALNSNADVALLAAFDWIDAHFADTTHYLKENGAPEGIAECAATALSS
jgi:protein-tyrosine phosphatase